MNTMRFAGILAALGGLSLVAGAFVGVNMFAGWLVIGAEGLLAAAGAVVIGHVLLGVIADVVLE